jgi:hypothetical protein
LDHADVVEGDVHATLQESAGIDIGAAVADEEQHPRS